MDFMPSTSQAHRHPSRAQPSPRAGTRRRKAALLPAVLPRDPQAIEAVAAQCRQQVARRAMLSAGASVVPLPGFDLLADVAVLSRLLHEINEAFGLTPAQIEALSPQRRFTVYKAVNAAGATAVGRLVTRELLAMLARGVARKLATKTVLRFVPLAGQALAAGISYGLIRLLGERHIADCVRVATAAIDVE
jgi:uncharacterized protein (DUF697 family)